MKKSHPVGRDIFDGLFLTFDEKSTLNDLQTKPRNKSDRINLLNARVGFFFLVFQSETIEFNFARLR